MAMTLLRARKRTNGTFYVRVHLDDSRLSGGAPDPLWVREYLWPPTPDGVTQTVYVTQIKAETKALCLIEVARMNASGDEGTALPGEGQPL